jgi:hypothetical protein
LTRTWTRITNAARVAGCSVLALIPCFWLPRIQAGDLSSHLYNAWLAQLIERGQAPGLALAHQTNNILFDLLLSGLWRAWGPQAAERIAVSIAVLVFFWGAFALVWSAARARSRPVPWHLAPLIAMLAYGWVFHMGLFNFYIALGLGCGALALAARPGVLPKLAAVALLGVAWIAHPMPVGWAIAVLTYQRAAAAIRPRYRIRLGLAALTAVAIIAAVLYIRLPSKWFLSQIFASSGAEQTWVFGMRYFWVAAALAVVWGVWLRRQWRARGSWRMLRDARFQVWVLCAVSGAIVPGAILLPGMRHTLNAVAERLSLGTAVLFLAMPAAMRPRRAETAATAALALLFFGFLYTDERSLNAVENSMAKLVARLPPNERVVSLLADPDSRVPSLAHLVDRVCIGRCFSYGNYEPSTAQFRVRAGRPNPYVVWRYGQSWEIQTGGYLVEPGDLPLYKIDLCPPPGHGLCITPVPAGARLQNTWLRKGERV